MRELPQKAPAAAPPGATGDGVKISNPERLLWPESGISKQQLVDYYRAIGPVMAVWAANRPLPWPHLLLPRKLPPPLLGLMPQLLPPIPWPISTMSPRPVRWRVCQDLVTMVS